MQVGEYAEYGGSWCGDDDWVAISGSGQCSLAARMRSREPSNF